MIQETIKLAGNQIKLAGVHLDVSILPNLPRIHGDHQQLSQVFLNILLNALDVIPKGGRIQVSVAHEDPNFVAAKITDNGPGIPEHILPNIFDPFFTTKTQRERHGIGFVRFPGDHCPTWRTNTGFQQGRYRDHLYYHFAGYDHPGPGIIP